MNKDNYLSVKEFAEAVGVSKQAVYKQLSTKLNNYTLKVDNRVMIDSVAITEVYHKRFTGKVEKVDQVDSQPSKPSQPVESVENDTYRDSYIRLLERQLEAAEERERNLNNQVEKLYTVIEGLNITQRQLVAENNQYKALIEAAPVEDVEHEVETVEQPVESVPVKEDKKGLFSFLRRK